GDLHPVSRQDSSRQFQRALHERSPGVPLYGKLAHDAARPMIPMTAFLFTDIEGSTRLWQQHPEMMRTLLARHDALLRTTIEQSGGRVFKMMGDACCAAFPTPDSAVNAAVAAQRLLRRELPELRVRMALHLGEAEERD